MPGNSRQPPGKWRRLKTPSKREIAQGNAFLAPSPMQREVPAAEGEHQDNENQDERSDRDKGALEWLR